MGAIAVFLGLIFWLILFAVGTALYCLPTIIAVMQHRTNVAVVAVVNILLGWSFIGWIIALVLALSKEAQPVQVVQIQQHMGYSPIGNAQGQPYGQQQYIPGSQLQPFQQRPRAQVRPAQQHDHDHYSS